jgi:hypothetical protein
MLPSKQILVVPIVLCLGLAYYAHHSLSLRNDEIERDIIMTAQSTIFVDNIDHDNGDHPNMTGNDLIYSHIRNTSPIVNEEYNIIFFQVAKGASSEWIRFFMRLNNDPRWCSNDEIHNANKNGLKYLSDYNSPVKIREMMTSPDWTRAIFVRHPVPRILSSFLDKSIEKRERFESNTCRVYSKMGKNYNGERVTTEKSYDECVKNHFDFGFFLKEITTILPDNVHWRSIYSRIDEKWWPYINVIGYMENLSDDAKVLLKSIHSNITGESAWDKIGKTGWSDNERECKNRLFHKGNEFLQKRDKRHTTNAREKMQMYYTPELEKFVEERYADDMSNAFYQFESLNLFEDEKN